MTDDTSGQRGSREPRRRSGAGGASGSVVEAHEARIVLAPQLGRGLRWSDVVTAMAAERDLSAGEADGR